jgi:outer membrane protein assembly factor BamE
MLVMVVSRVFVAVHRRTVLQVQPLQSSDHIAQSCSMSETNFLRASTLLLAGLLMALAGCASPPTMESVTRTFSPYKFDKVQGNVVTREQAEALRLGMSKSQVRDILGTPLLTSVFRTDRWDYAFTLQRQGAEPQSRHFAVYFKDDLLEQFDKEDLPREADFVATIKTMREISKMPALAASAEALQSFAPQAIAPAQPAPATTPTYPPLEPRQP